MPMAHAMSQPPERAEAAADGSLWRAIAGAGRVAAVVFVLNAGALIPAAGSAGATDAPAPFQTEDVSGPVQQWFKDEFVGPWTVKVTLWPEIGQPPIEATGKVDFSLAVDGRYLEEALTAETPMGLFRGLGFTAYDNASKRFSSFWMDNSGTGITSMLSEPMNGPGTLVLLGTLPATGNDKPAAVKTITRVIDHRTHSFEWFVQMPNGEWAKHLLVVYTRAD
jgi:hypothetical protein